MANYTIIGGDNKEYGPVTAEDIRQWVLEGRLDGNSQVRSDADFAWRPLATFPEFASSFQPRSQPPPLTARQDMGGELAAAAVNAPALCLIVSGMVNILIAVWGVIDAVIHPINSAEVRQMITSNPMFGSNPDALKMLDMPAYQYVINHYSIIQAINMTFALVMSIIIVIGAQRMKMLRTYEFAVVVAIMAVVPCLISCTGYIFLLPAGIWALVVLRKPGVREQFH